MSEHGVYWYRSRGCRCDVCRAAMARIHTQYRLDRLKRDVPPDIHGKYATYVNWSCRCEACSSALSEYRRQRRLARKEKADA